MGHVLSAISRNLQIAREPFDLDLRLNLLSGAKIFAAPPNFVAKEAGQLQ